MIGTQAFLTDLALPLIPILISVLAGVALFRNRRVGSSTAGPAESGSRVKGAIVIAVLLLLSATGIFRLARQYEHQSKLQNLTVSSVAFIQIGDRKFERPNELGFLVGALRDTKWFSSNHGGWAQAVDLLIVLKSGQQQRYKVARYLRQEGAVIDFIDQDANPRSISHYGYAFAGSLSLKLDELGAPLPMVRNGD